MIAVTGLTGHSGKFFLKQLADNGFHEPLRTLVRAGSDTSALDSSGLEIRKIVGDLDDYGDLCALVKGADTVLHIAGIWYTPLLLRAIEETGGVKHAVLIHTSGIYSKYKMASEEYRQIEKDMQQYLDRGMNITLLRPTMIFGDMRDHNVSKFIRMVDRLPLMPEVGHGSAYIQPVNARDLAKLYYNAVTREHLPEREYIASGDRPITIHELTDMIGEYLGKKPKYISCPIGLAAFGGKLADKVNGEGSMYEEKVLRMGEDRSFSHEKAARDLGFEPEKYEIGLRREVEEYLSHGRK